MIHGNKVKVESGYVSSKAKLEYGVGIEGGTYIDELVRMGRFSYTGMYCQIVTTRVCAKFPIGS
jgi:hypothetical protein